VRRQFKSKPSSRFRVVPSSYEIDNDEHLISHSFKSPVKSNFLFDGPAVRIAHSFTNPACSKKLEFPYTIKSSRVSHLPNRIRLKKTFEQPARSVSTLVETSTINQVTHGNDKDGKQ
jgi:hypothetical protein